MPLLRPLGSRPPDPAPMNPEEAAEGQRPGEPGDILTFGEPERRSRFLPGGLQRPVIAAVAAGIVIGALTLAVVVPAHHDATSRAPATIRTQRPPTIDVLIAGAVSFPLKGAPGALL